MKELLVDFGRIIKPVKELHGVNCAPYSKMSGADQPMIRECFGEIGVPYSRTHDCQGGYGGCYFIDVPNIFRNFDADENDEESYDFYYSDEYLKAIVEAGTKIVYRLGVTIEWGSKKYTCHPPKDFAKWARICEHIIMHYNEGWANGFHFGIEYWEIWNEPENPPMWTGTRDQFFELYRVSATYLKKRFPNIKIGGYGSCGFYAITSKKEDPFMQMILQYFYDFLDTVRAEGLPLDFFSYHLYSDDVREMTAHAAFARRTLDEYGFTSCELHFNEWNVGGEGGGFHLMRNMTGASYAASVLCQLQNTDYVDKAMYYVFTALARYNGLFDLHTYSRTCTYYTLAAFGRLFRLGSQVLTECDTDGVYLTAAVGEEGGGVLLANYDGEAGDYTLRLDGMDGGSLVVYRICEVGKPLPESEVEVSASLGRLTVSLPEKSVLYIEWKRG